MINLRKALTKIIMPVLLLGFAIGILSANVMSMETTKNTFQQLDENELAKKVQSIDENDTTIIAKYEIEIRDGGNIHTFVPDPRNQLPLFDIKMTDVFKVTEFDAEIHTGHLATILASECAMSRSDVGIGEFFFWRRSLVVYFLDNSVSKDTRKALEAEHAQGVRLNVDKRIDGKPFAIVCTMITTTEK